MLLALKASTQ